MAAQCRSPRCTAERKGFRRELDSWRHRLIHCVGFESILEGLYGPGLRRDLSLFDDCEPEELVDWCADDKCSLCSLRKDSVGDCTQSAGSAQSTPTEELISQGQFSEETFECQAEDYLNALFQKKDLPQNCDPNIPLVAQELLKKMIRQFAVEYISKSSKEHHENYETAMERTPACNVSQEEQEGPLDLTVTRFQDHNFLEEEEVLDLSLKRNNALVDLKNRSSKTAVINLHNHLKSGKATKPSNGDTVLCEVLNSLCLYHKQQLTFLLRFLKEEQKVCSEVCFSKTNLYSGLKMSSRKENSPAVFYSFAKQRPTRRGRLKRQEPYSRLPCLSVCLKDLRLTCPSLASGTVKLDSFKNQNLRLEESSRPLNGRNLCQKEQPSRPLEYFGHCSCNWDRTISETLLTPQSLQFEEEMQVQDILSQRALKDNCDQSPSLIQTTGEYRKSKLDCAVISKKQGKVAVNDQNKSAFVLQNLMDTFNDKFQETTNSPNLYNNERKRIHGVKFGNLIKHFINNVKLNDRSYVEMFNQNKKSIEAKIMQTRFRKRQEKLLSALKSPGCALSRQRSLEIKRELKILIETFRKKMTSHEKNQKKPARNTDEINNYIKGHPSFISESDYSRNAQAVSKVRDHVTHLPHTNRGIILKNDKTTNNFHKVPDHLPHSAPQKHTAKTKDIESRKALETQENALKKSKTRNDSAEFYSLQNSGHLFCKCTLNQISGMLTNIHSDHRNHKTANLPNNKAHLLVVVDRLKDSGQLNNILSRKPNAPQCQTKSTSNSNVEQHECGLWRGKSDRLSSQKGLSVTSVKNKDILNSNSSMDLAKNKQGATAERAISKLYPLTRISSPIKVMFVSEITRDDGIHYTLSPEYKPSNSRNAKESNVCSKEDMIKKRNVSASNFCQSQDYNKTRLTNKLVQHTSSDKIHSSEEWFIKRNPGGLNTISAHSLKLVRRTPERPTNLQMNLSKHFGKLSKYKISNRLLRFNTKKSRIARRGIRIAQRILLMSHKVSANCNKPLSDGCIKIPEPKQSCSSQSKVQIAKQTYSDPSWTRNENTSKSVSPFGHKLIIAKKDKKWHCRQSSQKPTKPKKKRNVRSSLLRIYQLCQRHTKLKRPVLHSLASLTTFSFRSALYHHCNRISSNRRKLKNKNKPFNLQSNSGSMTNTHENTVNHSTGFILEGAPDIQSNRVLNWWSTSASNESLSKELDNRYEKMASTWVHENNRVEKRKMEKHLRSSGETSQKPSPIQMLFQKKSDFKQISPWLMQTTETQSLSITRKAIVHNPPKKKRKGTKFKLSKVRRSKQTRKCARLSASDTSKEKQPFANLSQIEHFCTRNVKYVKPGLLQQKDSSQVKKKINGGDKCHNIFLNKLDASSRKLNIVETVLHGDDPLSETLTSKVNKPDDLWKNEQAKQMKTYKSTKIQEIKDIRICLKRLNDNSNEVPNKNLLERVQFMNANKVNKRPLRSNFCLRSKIQSLEMNDFQAKPFNSTPQGKQFPKKHVCLRNLQREESHPSPLFAPLSKRKRSKQASVHTETGSKKCKSQYSAHGQKDFSKIQLVPLKPVGLKSFKGLSNKDGSFSLTPIRIPIHGSKK
ncbi:uncharacterized protein LOC108698049 isoform X2 [Xenopus laevis]|uniref:Uncharacterized protein LOC108698049 isoform X2 n=2 Tax=Xenopus laevis TaxID=8355 RepID=A0A1L8HTL1_XENLA|nr:uncharacterized protein LOC108698049 isoform X2 [Xenopus laevis]OCT99387.1 hypothetical protein XELAEV_18005165mg [Xenopus laevis]